MAIINVAKNAGFCFGVKRATDAVENAIKENNADIYTLGTLIHNDEYNEGLKSRGVKIISFEDIPSVLSQAKRKVLIIVRAHGEIQSNLDKLNELAKENNNLTIINATCPYVEKVRKVARENSSGDKVFLLMGDANHPEVRGIISCANENAYVVSSAKELSDWLSDKSLYDGKEICIAAQTTFKLSEWEKSLEILNKVYTKVLIFDTICRVTEIRQNEAKMLSKESDCMIVIGSKSSSNTCKLYEICKENCKDSYLISGVDDLIKINVSNCNKISITAGASTPDGVIQEVEKTMSEQMENFAELLEASMKTLNTGDIVEGVVTSVSNNEIHVDLGVKTTGVITHEKATTDASAKLDQLFKVGDVVKAKVVKVSDIDGIATLDKTRVDAEQNWYGVVEAYKNGEVLEGKVTEAVKGGVIVTVNSVRVFVPASQTGVKKDGDLSVLVGQVKKVKLIDVKTDRKKAFGSIVAIEREERKAQKAAFWASIEEGKVYEGVVKNLTNYGAFVDLGGVDGMVHTTELSWRRVRHPSEVVKVGDKLTVFVKSFDAKEGRISLGYRTEETNPWTIFTNKYALGDVASVKVVSVMPFGAFAEVVPGVDGLIHISQIADRKLANPGEVLSVGQVVDAKITDIDEENHKVSLSIRALLAKEEPEVAEEAVAEEAPAVFSTDDPDSYKNFESEEDK